MNTLNWISPGFNSGKVRFQGIQNNEARCFEGHRRFAQTFSDRVIL